MAKYIFIPSDTIENTLQTTANKIKPVLNDIGENNPIKSLNAPQQLSDAINTQNSLKPMTAYYLEQTARDVIYTASIVAPAVIAGGVSKELDKIREKASDVKQQQTLKKIKSELDADGISKTLYRKTPVVTFSATKWLDLYGVEQESPEINLYIADVSVSRDKKYVTTFVDNNQGSIKEYIGDGDWNISISATLISEDTITTSLRTTENNKPDLEVDDIRTLLNNHTPIPVVCTILNVNGIENIVITNYSLNLDIRSKNTYSLKITATSDNNDIYII